MIISFPPGEGTDEEHKHGHIIVNSVGFQDGIKYVYRPGEWKRKMKPLTNKLCEEYKLSIMPAEYAENPVNLSRKQWEYSSHLKI